MKPRLDHAKEGAVMRSPAFIEEQREADGRFGVAIGCLDHSDEVSDAARGGW